MRSIRFTPCFVEKIWGGRKMERLLGKELPAGKKIGESWEISGHPAHLTPAKTPPFQGMDVYGIAKTDGKDVFGRHAEACAEDFPLLLKFIDAQDVLSVQVHPDDRAAVELEGDGYRGKNECWLIVDCDKDAFLYKGFVEGASLEDFDRLLAEGRLEEILQKVPVQPGDFVNLPAGTVHAIGAGIVLCEIQQSSDLTYRVYDWNRVGADGKPRPLHVEKARRVMDFSPVEGKNAPLRSERVEGGERHLLLKSEKFTVERFVVEGSMCVDTGEETFRMMCVVEGEGTVNGEPVKRGDSFILPAAVEKMELEGKMITASAMLPDTAP